MRSRESSSSPKAERPAFWALALIGGLAWISPGSASAAVSGVTGVTFSAAGTSVLVSTFTLDTPKNERPLIVLAKDAGFTQVISSAVGSLAQQTTAFQALDPNTLYFLKIKVSTHSDGGYTSTISSRTLAGDGARLTGPAATLALQTIHGRHDISFPAGAFTQPVTVVLEAPPTSPPPVSGVASVALAGGAINISTVEGYQPVLPVTVSMRYRTSDASGLSQTQFVLGRWENGLWAPLPSTLDLAGRKVSAQTGHFSTFQIMTLGPVGALGDIRVFPNPFRPSQNQPAMTLTNLSGTTLVRIFTVLGEQIRELGVNSATASATWDGRNAWGRPVASGLYVAVVEIDGPVKLRRKLKLAVER